MTREEYLDAVSQIIKSDPRSATGLKASTLGNLILRAMREHWTAAGFFSLKELLQDLERRSLVRLDSDAQNALAVWSLDAPTSRPTRPTWIPLRKDVWTAFVSSLPSGRRFFDRSSGAVRMGLTEPPQPASQWAEIKRIGDETQKAWAREFLEKIEQGSNGVLREALGDATWYIRFPQTLRHANPEWLYRWNRTRSERVSECVRKWCIENSVDPDLTAQSMGGATFSAATGTRNLRGPDESARRQVLAAIARMTTEELMQIPVPAKYWVHDQLRTTP